MSQVEVALVININTLFEFYSTIFGNFPTEIYLREFYYLKNTAHFKNMPLRGLRTLCYIFSN